MRATTSHAVPRRRRRLSISDASRALGVPYQRLFSAIACGQVPAARNNAGTRWLIAEADLPAIATALGIATDDTVRP